MNYIKNPDNIKQNPNHIIQTIPTSKIIDFLNERGIKLTINDIVSPKVNTIEKVYTEILQFLNIPIIQSSNYLLSLFFVLKNVFNNIGTQTFKFSDMFNINNTKFPFFLSQLINFISHKESIKYLFDDIENHLNELNINKALLQEKIKEKEKILKTINVQEVESLEAKDTIVNKLIDAKLDNTHLKDQLATLMMKYKEIKNLRDSAMTTNSEKKMLLLNLKKEKDNLNSLVVNDKSIHTNLIYYRTEVPKVRNEIDILNKRLHETNDKINILDGDIRDLKRIYNSLLEIEKMDHMILNLRNTKIDLKMKTNNLVRELDFLISKRETNKKQIIQIGKENENLQQNAVNFSKKFQNIMNDLRSQIDIQMNESVSTKKQKEQIQKEIKHYHYMLEEKELALKKIELQLKERIQLVHNELQRFKVDDFDIFF
ncbi:putative kinetochore protein nuf2 [Cucumispora dikerogammari]|nr:putative kinetochore protein nuf2 [Cucumispora dikerogammari]